MMSFCSTKLKGTNLAAGHHLLTPPSPAQPFTCTNLKYHMLSSLCKVLLTIRPGVQPACQSVHKQRDPVQRLDWEL